MLSSIVYIVGLNHDNIVSPSLYVIVYTTVCHWATKVIFSIIAVLKLNNDQLKYQPSKSYPVFSGSTGFVAEEPYGIACSSGT